MSLLKDKRIQKILAQAEEDASSSGDDGAPITFSSKFSSLQKKKEKKTAKKEKEVPAAPATAEPSEVSESKKTKKVPPSPIPEDTSPTPATTSEVSDKAQKQKKEKNNAGKKDSKKETSKKDEKKDSSKAEKEKKEKSSKSGKKGGGKNSQKDDDDALLNELLGSDVSDEEESAASAAAESAGVLHPPIEDPSAVLTMATVCDVKGLDYRTERIKNFGKDSVPDVSGDELRRNGIALPKIKKGPFVTPNLNSGHWYTLGSSGSTVELREEARSGFVTSSSSSAAATASPSPLTSPNRQAPASRAVYVVDVQSKGYIKAHNAFEFTVNTSMGDINALFSCWQEHPYHLPMILQLSQAFHVTGDTANSNLFLDLALHVLGMTLGTCGFSIPKTPRERVLPYHYPANKPLFVALLRGMHSALRQGGAHTAFELCRALLSMDEEDPEGAVLMLDVTAIRSREWLYLIELHHRLMHHGLVNGKAMLASTVGPSSSATDKAAAETPQQAAGPVDADGAEAFATPFIRKDAVPTGLEWVGLPSIHFNAALARHMHANTSGGEKGKGADKVKGNRTAGTAGQRTLVTPPAGDGASAAAPLGASLCGYVPDVRALANAIGLFPQAALALAEGIEERMANDPWHGLTFMNEDAKQYIHQSCGASGPYIEATLTHLAKLFAVGSKGMWKSTQHAKFFRDAATIAVEENLVGSYYSDNYKELDASVLEAINASSASLAEVPLPLARSAFGAHVRRLLGTVLHDRYVALPEENVTGVFATQIPRELLEAAEEEDRRAEAQRMFERVPEHEARLLGRYEAAFGPLDPNMRFAERMEAYGARLEEHVRALGRDEGAVRMFLRTMLPWNDVQEMGLRRAFEEAGVEDPAIVARRMQRQFEWDVMDRADALAPDEDLPPDQW